MLLKLILDGTLRPNVDHQLSSNVAIWIVQESLPLDHAKNAESLCTALGFSKGTSVDLHSYAFVTGTNSNLDLRKSPKALSLSPGQQLVLCLQQDRPMSRDVSSLSLKQSSTVGGSTGASPPTSPRGAGGRDDDDERGAFAARADDDEDETYHARQRGWMPFSVRTKQGRPVVTFVDPFRAILETDAAPPVKELCEQCASAVASADPLRVAVDRHYRPSVGTQDVVEGWVEKLGGGTFTRWQRRYLTVTEKSLDWFNDKPEPGDKKKIAGFRLFVRDGTVLLASLSDAPDHPKCKEEGYYYFSIGFKDDQAGDKEFYFRVPSAKERSIYLNFLRLCQSRLKSRGANRNPVFWKRWADAFLSNAADLGSLHASNLEAAARFEAEMAALQSELEATRAKMPRAQAQLDSIAAEVQALNKQIAEREARLAKCRDAENKSAGVLQGEKDLLRAKEAELGDEIKKFRMLEQHTNEQREGLCKRREELAAVIETIRRRHTEIFAKWRKGEERQISPLRNPTAPTLRGANGDAASSSIGVVALVSTSSGVKHGGAVNLASPSTDSVEPLLLRQSSESHPRDRSTAAVARLSFSPVSPKLQGETRAGDDTAAEKTTRHVSPSRANLHAAVAAARASFSNKKKRSDVVTPTAQSAPSP